MGYLNQFHYEKLEGNDYSSHHPDEETDYVPQDVRSDHFQNIDRFLINIYEFYHLGGIKVMVLDHVLSVIKFSFLFFLSIELLVCTKWKIILQPDNRVYYWSDVFEPPGQCWSNLSLVPSLFLVVAIFILAVKLVRSSIRILKFYEVEKFYKEVLNIPTEPNELSNTSWNEIQKRLIDVQDRVPLTSQKDKLTSLDLCNRILRYDNYLIAMFQHDVIPVKFEMPKIFNQDFGYVTYLTSDYELNIKFLLFYSPWSPFKNYFQLHKEYKWITKKFELAKKMSDQIFLLGIFNLMFMPVFLMVKIIIFVCANVERIRFEPHSFASRRWSRYANYALRHFNELPHQLNTRLSRAYKPAQVYLDCFPSKVLTVIVSHVGFIAGGVTAALLLINLICDDFFHLPGYLGLIFAGGLISKTCSALLPEEYAVYTPRSALLETLKHIHYLPDDWKENAHTYKIRNKFARLCQYKFIGAIEELISPIITPFILMFVMPKYSLQIVDFLRNYSVDEPGVGDICHYGRLDIGLNGDKMWHPDDELVEESKTEEKGPPIAVDSFNGRTELSLLHFNLMNPINDLPLESKAYLDAINSKALREFRVMRNSLNNDNFQPHAGEYRQHGGDDSTPGMFDSLYADKTLLRISDENNLGIMRHIMSDNEAMNPKIIHNPNPFYQPYTSQTEDPSIHQNVFSSVMRSHMPTNSMHIQPDLVNMDMSVSALYIHEIHQRKKNRILTSSRMSDNQDRPLNRGVDSSMIERSLYRSSGPSTSLMANRQEPGIVRHIVAPSNNRIERLPEVDAETEENHSRISIIDKTLSSSPSNIPGINIMPRDWPDLPPTDS